MTAFINVLKTGVKRAPTRGPKRVTPVRGMYALRQAMRRGGARDQDAANEYYRRDLGNARGWTRAMRDNLRRGDRVLNARNPQGAERQEALRARAQAVQRVRDGERTEERIRGNEEMMAARGRAGRHGGRVWVQGHYVSNHGHRVWQRGHWRR